MSNSIKRYTRQLHRTLAPIMVFPLLLSLITGVLFQLAAINDREADFIWLLALHRGKFGNINLENIYVFLNGLGLLFLVTTGIIMWVSANRRSRPSSKE